VASKAKELVIVQKRDPSAPHVRAQLLDPFRRGAVGKYGIRRQLTQLPTEIDNRHYGVETRGEFSINSGTELVEEYGLHSQRIQ
jgi:hypothetical protein